MDTSIIKYIYICKSGRYKLRGGRTIFQCERNDDAGIDLKLKNVFDEFIIVDKNNNVVWDLNDNNINGISKMEETLFSKTVFWILKFK